MNLGYYRGLSGSVSRFALNIIFTASMIGGVCISSALAGETIRYDDTAESAELRPAPSFVSGDRSNSLFPRTETAPSAPGNTVIVDYANGSKTNPNFVFGGLVRNGKSEKNKVYIQNGGVINSVYGGYGGDAQGSWININVSGNIVKITSGSVGQNVYGGYGQGSGQVSGNAVEISGGSVSQNVYGGSGLQHDGNSVGVMGNNVKISDGNISGSVYGGYRYGQSWGDIWVNRNIVEINSGNIQGNVSGGYRDGAGNGSSITNVGYNTIKISGGSVGRDVYGGFSVAGNNSGGTYVFSNNVKISGGNISGSVYGGYGQDYGRVYINNVEISGGSVSQNVYGGYAEGEGDRNGFLTINNTVTLSDKASVGGDVYGGYGVGSRKIVTDNTVTLIGDQITIGNSTRYGSIWGGFISDRGTIVSDFDKVVKGNTLNLVGYRGTVSGVYNFENYNWTLPKNVVNGDTLITIADGGTAVDLTNTKHSIVDMQVGDNRLQDGDKITLISKSKGTWTAQGYKIKQGQFIVYDATLKQETNGSDQSFVLTIDKMKDNSGGGGNGGGSAAKVNPQSKSYSEGRAAALGFLNQGNDLIANAGISKIRSMVLANEKDATRPAVIPFIIANGSSQNYKTGSHVDVRGFNTAMGLATGFTFASGHKATLGAFFEYGRGTYDTFNSFADYASVHGDGDTDYKGGGIFGRIEFAGTGLGRVTQLTPDQADGLYAEASLRIGRAKSKFDVGRNANVLGEFTGVYRGAYDSKATYYGGHVAGGYVFNFDNKQSLDVYGRYLWTHMDSDTVTIANEKLRFDDANSSRIQLGGRYAYVYSDQFQPYIGAAYEYEFDGEIKAKAYEFNLDRPSLKGSTGIFEAGFSFQPLATNKAFNIDVNGQAYVGQRQGGGGGIKLKYQF